MYKEDNALRGRKTPGKGTEWQFARTDKMARFRGLFSEFGKIFKRRKISFVIKHKQRQKISVKFKRKKAASL